MRDISRSPSAITSISEGQQPLRYLTAVDWGLLCSAVALACVGLATVHSASSELAIDYLPRQLIWVAVGFVAMVTAASLDYHTLLDLSPYLYGAGLGLLVLVYFFGQEAGGAQSRLSLGPVSLQPSELSKIAVTLLLSRYLAGANQRHLALRHLVIATVLCAAPMGLVMLEPDMGSAAMFLPILTGMVLVAGVRLRVIVAVLLLGMVLGAGVWTFAMKPYQRQRVTTFLAPGSDPLGAGYQVRQSKIAVGSGGLAGRGYMQGTQSQLRFLPARHTDFIFSVLAEEWGFRGVFGVFLLYGIYLVSGARVALRARNRAGIFLVVGLISLIAFHVLYNTAMVVGLVPITGIPLPFLSYGGTFTLMIFVATGLILGVDLRRYVNR
jgi:rod shape determining protein RodA